MIRRPPSRRPGSSAPSAGVVTSSAGERRGPPDTPKDLSAAVALGEFVTRHRAGGAGQGAQAEPIIPSSSSGSAQWRKNAGSPLFRSTNVSKTRKGYFAPLDTETPHRHGNQADLSAAAISGFTPMRVSGIAEKDAVTAQLVREVGRTTVQHVAGYERQQRRATMVARMLDITASLTDRAIDLSDRLVDAMFRKAETRQARAFQADPRAIN
jgi:hypothetical protein